MLTGSMGFGTRVTDSGILEMKGSWRQAGAKSAVGEEPGQCW